MNSRVPCIVLAECETLERILRKQAHIKEADADDGI